VLTFDIAAHGQEEGGGGGRGVAVATLFSAAVVIGVAVYFQPNGVAVLATYILSELGVGVAWVAGANLRRRRARWAELQARTERLEREHAEEARRAVDEERLRIARELHDVIAHSMSVIAVQSAVGHHVIDTQPAEARKERPDVILMDIRMPHLDGLEATRVICQAEETGHVKVLILTTFDLDEYVYAALRAGASGFLLKDTPPNDLLAGIRVIAAGDALLAPSVTRQLIGEFVRRPDSDRPPPATLDVLTGREREVLTLVARGWSNAEVAERLYLSPATAKTHVGRLLTKLQSRDRTQLVVIAYESGLVTPGGT